MDLDRWERERQPAWRELDDLLGRAKTRPERLGSAGVLRMGALHRSVLADLAYARRRAPAQPVTRRLEALALRGRQAVHAGRGTRRPGLLAFASHGFWRRVAERPTPVFVAAGLLVTGVVLGVVWGIADPQAARGLVPSSFIDGAAPPRGDQGLTTAQSSEFSASVLTNNIRVAGLCFAIGIAACVGGAALLVYNGAILGATVGVAFASGDGNGAQILRLVVAHGVLELSCIVVAGAAGLRIGWAVVRPGHRPRGEALVAEARRCIGIVAGVAVWLVVAGIVEGFVSPAGLSAATTVVIGVGLGALFWGLVVVRGRDHSSARDLAVR